MRFIIVTILITCATNTLVAQVTYFNKVYPQSGAENVLATNIIINELIDSLEIIAVSGGIGTHKLTRKRIDFNGILGNETFVNFTDTSLYPGIAESFKKLSNDYLCTYAYWVGGLVERYNADFERLWRFEIPNTDTSGTSFTSSCRLNNGNLICVGRSILQYDDIIGDDAAPIEIVNLSENGNQNWRKQIFTIKPFGRIYAVHELSNGDIILTGTQAFDYDAVVLRLDSLGNLIWQHTFQSPPEEEYDDLWAQSVLVNDSTIVMSYGYGYDDEYPPQPWQESSVRRLHIVKFNVNSEQIIWENSLEDIYGVRHYPNDIIASPDNGFAVVGNLYHAPLFWPIDSLYYGYAFSYIAKLNQNGELQWQRRYKYSQDTTSYSGDENLLYDIENTPDGGYVACGYVSDYDVNPEISAWVIKVDEFGCLEPGCQNVAVDEIRLDMEDAMTVYPNPVRSNCTVKLDIGNSKLHSLPSSTTLILTDPSGRQIQHVNIPPMGLQSQLELDMSGMASGMYQAHWLDGTALLDSAQIVKE